MDTLRLYTEERIDGGTDVVIEGDAAAFTWLSAAAGNARDGFDRNHADATDESGNRLVLRPEQPLDWRSQNPRSPIAHLQVGSPERPAAEKPLLEISRAAALELDGVATELLGRTYRLKIREEGPEDVTADPPRAEIPPARPPEEQRERLHPGNGQPGQGIPAPADGTEVELGAGATAAPPANASPAEQAANLERQVRDQEDRPEPAPDRPAGVGLEEDRPEPAPGKAEGS